MFYKNPPVATPFKRAVYLLASTFLGFLLSLIVHAGIETLFLRLMEAEGLAVRWFGRCALPLEVQYFLTLGGGILGFLLGRYWWRKIYIEKVWCQPERK